MRAREYFLHNSTRFFCINRRFLYFLCGILWTNFFTLIYFVFDVLHVKFTRLLTFFHFLFDFQTKKYIFQAIWMAAVAASHSNGIGNGLSESSSPKDKVGHYFPSFYCF